MVRRAGQGHSAKAWLCADPRPGQVAATLWTGSVGLLSLGLQPVPLRALFADNRMTLDEQALLVPAGQLLGAAIGPVGRTLLMSAPGVEALPVFGIAPSVRERKGSA